MNRIIPSTLFVVSLVLPLASCSKKASAVAAAPLPALVVTARTVTRADFADGPRLLGAIRGDVETPLSFRSAGIVEWIGADNDGRGWREGTFVKAGTVLARLVGTDFESAVQSAGAAVERERSAFERMKKLVSEKVVSPQDMDKAKAAWESAEADLRRATQARSDSVINAPQDGYVLARNVERGENVAVGAWVLRFGDFRRMSLTLAVPDRWVIGFREGMEIPFTVSAFEGRPFVGRVTEVGVAARANDRLFKVELKVENAEGLLRSGMTASIPIVGAPISATPAALIVPLAGLSTRASKGGGETKLIVFVADAQNIARERLVETGDIIGSQILVTGGELQAGERVILSAADELFDGASIEPRVRAREGTAARLARR